MKPIRLLLGLGLMSSSARGTMGPEILPTPPEPEKIRERNGFVEVPDHFAIAAQICPVSVTVPAPSPEELAAREKRLRRARRKNPSSYSSSNA